MRILIVSRCAPFPGGRENFVYGLAKELANSHEVLLCTPDPTPENDFKVQEFPKSVDEIFNLLNKIQPDIINFHTFLLCFLRVIYYLFIIYALLSYLC